LAQFIKTKLPVMPDRSPERYWKRNLTYVSVLLVIWFIAGYCLSIFWAKELNAIRFGGFKLGFWFAHQGAIYVFVLLIFIYVRLMNRLDRKYHLEED
jgi:putative solute:sodium symporter small subunit